MSRTYEQLEPVISALDERIKTGLGAFPTDTAEGSIASFPDGADGIPLKSLVVNIDPVQSGSGDPSPENICPVTGWTGCEVQRTGKNLLSLVESEMVSSGWNRIFPISLKAGTYIISCQNQFGASVKGASVTLVDDNATTVIKQLSGYEFGDSTFVGRATTITEEEASKIKNLQFSLRASGATYNDIVQGNIKLELGSTATPYEPYTGQTYPITFPTEAGTVYGGYVDVTGGELVTCPYFASYNGETLTGEWISDRDKYVAGTTPTIGAQVVNIGAVGEAYPLTATEIKTLLGQNNIWADTGDSSVEYRADTKLYIERLTEPDADMIADANITSGSYFMVGNTLYKATANIASGSAVIEGTNCTQKSLSEALNEINS